MRPSRFHAAVILCLMAGLSAPAHAAAPQTAGDMGAMATPSGRDADADMHAGMQHMQTSMHDTPMTGDPDHDFVTMMLPHHEGAVSMAKVELRHGKDPALLKLARDIVASQDREISFMKAWLAAHPAAGTSH